MKTMRFNAGSFYCYDCVIALRRFVGGIKGIGEVEVDGEYVMVTFDPQVIADTEVRRIVSESAEKLGYRVIEE